MYIHSYGRLVGQPVEDIQYYKQLASRYTQLQFRRANRFVLLSLTGACRCVHGHAIKSDTAVYLTTENGNLGDTESVLDQIFHHHQFPLPYNFINTMSNTASFYVAQNLNLFGRNLTFSSKQLSFERGIELLRSDLQGGAVSEALIGGVDEACFSKQFKLRRTSEQVAMVEGSCWLWVKNTAEKAIGRIRELRSFPDFSAAVSWFTQPLFSRPAIASFGPLVSEQERRNLAATMPGMIEFDHIAAHGYCASATACGLTGFLEGFPSGNWVHLNKDDRGQFVVLAVEKY